MEEGETIFQSSSSAVTFFSSIHGIIATINEGGDRFRFGRLDTKEGETKTFASRL